MRKEIQIETVDNKTIHGTLDSVQKSDKLLIFIHGITGDQYEHHYMSAASFFPEKGIDIFRFDLYSRLPNARPLLESSITTHCQDLKTVIDYFKNDYDQIILVGHSVGALVILETDLSDVAKIVLWDPTGGFDNIKEKKGEFIPELGVYFFHWGMEIVVSKKMIEEWRRADLGVLAENLSVPCKFIFAGKGKKKELWAPYFEKIKTGHESVVVEGASHRFIEEGVCEEAHGEILKWVN